MKINDKFIVGLSGGIGSGKTTVSDQFKILGVDVIDADVISHQVTEQGQPAINDIKSHFGEKALLKSGGLNRSWMRQHIFKHPEEKIWLENLLHPLINEAITQGLKKSCSAYTIFVSPLLLKSPHASICNRILIVECSKEQQVDRTLARDQSSKKTINAIIASQSSHKERLHKADDIIDNSKDLNHLLSQVSALHKNYLKLATKNK